MQEEFKALCDIEAI
ncbi:hypothetical protein ACHAWC_000473, partial [Mediolabrus comicus]